MPACSVLVKFSATMGPLTSPCVSSGHWTEHQRHKQYEGGHNETYNGVTLNVDSTCSNGPTVALAPFNGNSACL